MACPHPNLDKMVGKSGREGEAKRCDFSLTGGFFLQSGGIFFPPTPVWEILKCTEYCKRVLLQDAWQYLLLHCCGRRNAQGRGGEACGFWN